MCFLGAMGMEDGKRGIEVGERMEAEVEVGERESRFDISSVVFSLPWFLSFVAATLGSSCDGEAGEAGEVGEASTPPPASVAGAEKEP
jgi:hypothetical protein